MRKLLGLLCLLSALATQGFAGENAQPQLILTSPGEPLPHLVFSPHIRVKAQAARLEGQLSEAHTTLAINFETVKCDEKGRFSVHVPLERGRAELTIQVVDVLGNLAEEHALLETGEEPPRTLSSVEPGDSLGVSQVSASSAPADALYVPPLKLSAELTDISYQQPGTSVAETAITAKASFNPVLVPQKWDLGLSSYFTAAPLSASGAPESIRFFGLNANLGYEFPASANGLRFGLRGGLYYVTSMVSQGSYGFINMYGPEIFPTLSETFSQGSRLNGYLKYAPVSDKMQLEFSSYEVAGGLSFQPSPKHSFYYSLDVARLNLQASGATALTTSISLGVGIGL